MRLNLRKFLKESDITEEIYPGKRIVKPCKPIGDYKNHCVVIDWRDPDMITLSVRPGLTGKSLAPEIMKQYPVCLQNNTAITIKILDKLSNDNEKDEDEDDEEEKSKGKSGGGGKKPARKKLEDMEVIGHTFSDHVKGKIPNLGEVTEMMVMGIQIAKHAFQNAMEALSKQMSHAHISATDILAHAGDFVTRVSPPSFIAPKGDETAQYHYDRNKNADIGMKLSLG